MRCKNCGAELADGSVFCRECGTKVDKIKKFCRECGAEITDGGKFCSNCGAKVNFMEDIEVEEDDSKEDIPTEIFEEQKEAKKVEATSVYNDISQDVKSDNNSMKSKSLGKKKAFEKWNGLDLFYKIIIVGMGISILLLLIALLAHKNLPIFFSTIQIGGLIIAILIHKNIIKSQKDWPKYVILVVILLFTGVNVASYSWRFKTSTTTQTSLNDAEQAEWSSFTLSKLLPEPQSNMMELIYDGQDWFDVTVHDITKEDYKEYVCWCKDNYGFNVDSEIVEDFFSANNKDGYFLMLFYTESSQELSIALTAATKETDVDNSGADYEIDYTDAESFEKALNEGEKVNGKVVQFIVQDYKPDSALGINCWAGEHLNFISEDELDVVKGKIIVGRVTKEPSKTLGSWKIPYEVLSISEDIVEEETSESSELEEQSETSESQSQKIMLTMGADDFKGMKLEDAEEKFREMGFTNFKYETIDTEKESDTDTICYIEITEVILGDSKFVKGDKFAGDSTITFYSYKYKEPEVQKSLFYSTNDYDTAQKGDTGVFSYVDKGNSYDIYWIIDFDEGYAYYFTEGNGEATCDRLKIDSGTLNDKVTITYHDGSDTWSYNLHFKYIEHPETLIMVDQNGFDYKYSTTDLDDALSLRAKKTIKDY